MTVWITGAANGIGKHLAFEFFKKGYNVIVSDIDLALLTTHFFNLDIQKVLYFKHDISIAAEWSINLEKSIKKFHKIDILINTAAIIKPGFLHEISIEDIDNHIDINSKALMYSTKLISDHMVKYKSGHIINFSSLAGVAPI